MGEEGGFENFVMALCSDLMLGKAVSGFSIT